MKSLRAFGAAAAVTVLVASASVLAGSYTNAVAYTGQGLIADGFGGYALVTEICAVFDEDGNIIPDQYGQKADAAGPYLLWVLTATGATQADITGPWGTVPMTKTANGSFKYVSGWYNPDTLPGHVSATYNGSGKKAQLVISHGCRPYLKEGAWCSPGFWKNAENAAWELTGSAKGDFFNLTVVPDFYATASVANPTLETVLKTPGANTFGSAAAPYGLNAFNATGAFLTNNIPGYAFSLDALQQDNESDTCPIDHHGNFK